MILRRVSKRWTMPIGNWGLAMRQLAVIYGEESCYEFCVLHKKCYGPARTCAASGSWRCAGDAHALRHRPRTPVGFTLRLLVANTPAYLVFHGFRSGHTCWGISSYTAVASSAQVINTYTFHRKIPPSTSTLAPGASMENERQAVFLNYQTVGKDV